MNKFTIYASAMALIMASCGGEPEKPNDPVSQATVDDEALYAQASALFKALPEAAENPNNLLTVEKIALGKALYFENRLSKQGNQSCNTCHNLETFGVDNLPTSPGDDGTLGGRNSPTVYNAALHFVQFWDGRAADVEEQAGGPILNPVEMGMPDEASVVKRLKGIPEYVEMFKAAFPEDKDPVTFKNLTLAIAAFERTLLTPGRWDKYLQGDKSALTSAEKEGLDLFMKSGCITCHTGNNLGGHMYQKFGLLHPYWDFTGSTKIDEGRFEVTQNEADKYIFKVPSLRNIAKTAPYFHDGSVADLAAAVRIMAKTQLNKELTSDEINAIVTFLEALTGEVPASALPEKEMASL